MSYFDNELNNTFEIIRKYSKYCSICGKNLKLNYIDWHLPFCIKCRHKILKKSMDEWNKNYVGALMIKKRHIGNCKILKELNNK
jgi:endogenous inhibitor of DNA gyrase (YacG/DUF329 family)